MIRSACKRLGTTALNAVSKQTKSGCPSAAAAGLRSYSDTGPRPHTSLFPVVSEGTWLQKNNYAQFDGWELRQLINFVAADDGVPEPEIIIEVLKGCRNNNDYALAIRFLEVVRLKGGNKMSEIWPYIMQEIGPTMQELGISTLKEMGYEEPELWLEKVDDM
uniref:Cytochrome c oxidase subunit 5A, mitochondrial n=1 Tax=Crassostrea virginica TaxID=6565 RepID=A0A8B8E286_CRAVI|nr:cytochrome c oxidase subunit 5A, mitochondrial-like [Crassostrea virginica]XP_022333376.1 cytochrome c oxidase subunit 5A, mitochondrial-like [Crassostrea virginica]